MELRIRNLIKQTIEGIGIGLLKEDVENLKGDIENYLLSKGIFCEIDIGGYFVEHSK